MGGYEYGLPVDAKQVKFVYGDEVYQIDDTYLVEREGEDGTVKVLMLEGGDLFGGHYLQGWFPANQPSGGRYGHKVDGSGVLQLELEPSGAGSLAQKWLGRRMPMILCKDLEFTFEMELPASDAGAPGSDPFKAIMIFNTTLEGGGDPETAQNHFEIIGDVTEDGLLYELKQRVAGSLSTIWDGSTYEGDTVRDESANPVSLWRFVMNARPGSSGATMTVYVKMAANRAGLAAAAENQLTDGVSALTFDISTWEFYQAFAHYKLETENTTYFNDSNPFYSTEFTVTYPTPFSVRADSVPAAGEYLGAVQIYDEDGQGGTDKTAWRKVFRKGHQFSGDIVLDNSLIRLQIDEATLYGFKFSGYISSAWKQPNGEFYLRTSQPQNLSYPVYQSIRSISPEAVTVRVRMTEDGVDDGDWHADIDVTMRRGSRVLEIEIVEVYPLDDVLPRWEGLSGEILRFGYVEDGNVGQDDNNDDGTNAAPLDGLLMAFDQDDGAYMCFMSINQDPVGGSSRLEANDGGDLEIDAIDTTDLIGQEFCMGITPYAHSSFAETEDEGTEGAPTLATDAGGKATPTAGSDNVYNLDAITEKVYWSFTADTDITRGLFAFIVHSKNFASGEDMDIYAWNQTDSEYRNQAGENVEKTLDTSYDYYEILFHVLPFDQSGGDEIRVYVEKANADVNPIYVDSYLVIPISNGEDWPLDHINNYLKTRTLTRAIAKISG